MKKNLIYLAGALLSSAILTFGCSEDIPSYRELTVDKTDFFIQADGNNPTAEFNITDGNGNYKISVADENIATATLDGTHVTLNGLKNGTTTVTITDWAKYSSVVNVKVKEDFELKLGKTELVMFLGENDNELVNIVSGNGGYQVVSSDNDIATAELNEEGKISVTAQSSGFCNVTVSDADGNKTPLKIRVCDEHLILADITGRAWVIGKPESIEITSGNGEYTAISEDPNIATVEITDNAVSITGISKGETNITVTDKMELTTTVKIRVAGEFKIETTSFDNLWIGETQEINIVDGSGNYNINSESSIKCELSKDKSKLIVTGVGMAFSQTIKVTDNVFSETIEISVKFTDYPFENAVARWFVQGAYNTPGSCSIAESNDITTIKAGEWYKPWFGDGYVRNGFIISFKGDHKVGEKTEVHLYPLNNSGKNGAEIQVSNVVMEKVQYDEGREPNGFFWIKFREEGKDYDSYLVAHT